MNPEVVTRARRRMRESLVPMGIVQAVADVRYEMFPVTDYPFLLGLDKYGGKDVEGDVGPFHVRVQVVDDPHYSIGEDDVTGTFETSYQPGDIDNTRGNPERHVLPWYRPPAYIYEEVPDMLRRAGMSRHDVAMTVRAIARQAMTDDRERYGLGVVVTVSCAGVELADSSLWGIDVIGRLDGSHYVIEQADSLVIEGLQEAEENLPAAIERAQEQAAELTEAWSGLRAARDAEAAG